MGGLIETIAFVFGLVALGYLAGWSGLLRPRVGEVLTEFAVAVAIPVLLFRTMIEADFRGAEPWALWATYFSAVAVSWALGQFMTTRLFGRTTQAGVVGGVAAAFSNLVLIGLPLIMGRYGKEGFEVLTLIVSVHLPVMMAASIFLFEWARRGETGSVEPRRVAAAFLRNLLANPLIVGILAGLLWRAAGFSIPALGMRYIDALAGVAGTVALFATGLSLRGFGISGNVMPAIALSAVKLFVMPAVVLLIAVLIGLPPFPAKIAVAAAALPTGVNPYLIASRFGTGQALATNTMTISTAAAAVSVVIWLVIADWVFG